MKKLHGLPDFAIENEIDGLASKFIYPNLEFSVLPLGEAMFDGFRYASVVVKNTEKYDIDNFFCTITGFAWQNSNFEWDERINFVNSNKKPVTVGAGSKDGMVTLKYQGGEARFNLANGDGESINVLNHDAPKSIKYGEEFRIKTTFKGETKLGLVNPIEKTYRLSCVYKDDEKKTGIYMVCFEEYNIYYPVKIARKELRRER